MAQNVGSALFGGYGADASAGGAAMNQSQQANGTGTTIAGVKMSVATMFLLAIVILALLHKAGFRFSVTVG